MHSLTIDNINHGKFRKILENILERNNYNPTGISVEEINDGEKVLYFDGCESVPLSEEWYLKGITDDEAQYLLEYFLVSGKLDVLDYSICCIMIRLLAEKGYLVKSEIFTILSKEDWACSPSLSCFLAGVCFLNNASNIIVYLLDLVPEDSRDGLFTACWKINNKDVDVKLLEKFEEWISKDETYGIGTGELGWVFVFLSKWTKNNTFSYLRLKKITQWVLIQTESP